MSFSDNLLAEVERYLDGNMTTEELSRFENQFKDNAELSEYIKLSKEMRVQYSEHDWEFMTDSYENDAVNALELAAKSEETERTKDVFKAASKSYFNEIDSVSVTPKKKKTKVRQLYYAIGLAASILLSIGLFMMDKKRSATEIYTDYSDWNELPSIVERGHNNDNKLLSKGEDAFLKGDYTGAKQQFAQAALNNFDVNIVLYLGVSYLELGDYENALANFKKVASSKSLDASKGIWYSGLTYLKMNDVSNAVKQFEALSKNATSYNHAVSKQILDQLEP